MNDSNKIDEELNKIFRSAIAFSKKKDSSEVVTEETRSNVK